MKRIIGVCLLLALLLALPMAVSAAAMEVKFTGSSSFLVGGTAKVDVLQTCRSVMDNAPDADMYNAALEQNMDVMWKCSNGPDKYGSPITWTADDAGKEYVCRVSFYADKAKTEFVDYIDSRVFTVAAAPVAVEPEITTKSLPEATVGESYYIKLKCNDPKASFAEYYNPGKANDLAKTGLTLTKQGELTGKPAKAGTYSFTVCAAGEGGEGYATYTLTVKEPAPTQPPTEETTLATTEATETQEQTTAATQEQTTPATQEQTKPQNADPSNEEGQATVGLSTLAVVLISVGATLTALVPVVIVLIVMLVKNKKK